MNIDVSNLVSLFSNVSGLDSLQLSESVEASSIEGFSEALMEQVSLLQEQGELPVDQKDLMELQELVENGEPVQLQEFAGLLNDYGKSKGLVSETGNKLPFLNKLEKNFNDINIEDAIDTLQDVMNHIASVTDFVEEKVVEVTEVIERAVTFLEGESVAEEHLDQQEKIALPLFSTQVEVPGDDADKTNLLATEVLVKDLSNDEVLLQSKSAIEDQAVKSNIIAEQTNVQQIFAKELEKSAPDQVAISNTTAEQANIQQVFAKELEKAKPVNPVLSNPGGSATNPDGVVEAVSDLEQEFLDDIVKNDQNLFKLGQENQVFDKAKQAEFDLNSLSTISGVEKPASNIAADISLLNRQMLNTVSDVKTEAPPMTRAFNHPEWQNEFSERIVWMYNKSVPAAELKLNPQHLGPISIRIDVSQDQATIGFTAQHASVREAIEAAIPRLREMLNSQQLNLAEVNVSQQDSSEQRHSQGFFNNGQKQNNQQGAKFSLDEGLDKNIENAAELTEEIERGRAVASNGILNIFA